TADGWRRSLASRTPFGSLAPPKLTLYVNGALEATSVEDEPWKSDASKPVSIGNNSSTTGRAFDGYLDEARVLNVPKDINWLKLEYESQREGQKFLSFGPTQTH